MITSIYSTDGSTDQHTHNLIWNDVLRWQPFNIGRCDWFLKENIYRQTRWLCHWESSLKAVACNDLLSHQQVTWLVVTDGWLQSAITKMQVILRLFFIVERAILRFLGAMPVFEVWASSSIPSLPLCQILLFFSLCWWAGTWRKTAYSLVSPPPPPQLMCWMLKVLLWKYDFYVNLLSI